MFYISIVSGSEPQGQISLGKYPIIKKSLAMPTGPHTRHLPAACLTYAYNETNKPYLFDQNTADCDSKELQNPYSKQRDTFHASICSIAPLEFVKFGNEPFSLLIRTLRFVRVRRRA